ncbi:MAG: hypothetical protein QM804_02795 [Propionicimonas sp.]
MGVFTDLWRLIRVAGEQRRRLDFAESLRLSADAAEFWSQVDPNGPAGTHGAATANPFANLDFYRAGIPASGTVVSLEPSGNTLDGVGVYDVVLDVRIDGQAPYRTTYRTVIAGAAMTNWQPGKVLPFRVSPADPHALLLG